ncbi:FAD binding domain-containing protein [Jiella sp. MQZ9-1]|uniref:FAD binding domain-containing protein n=1 Tax=Jiella flava TaxID=2816857 RepID=A0A939JUE9_9HYPH|nr:FAD binding domain-containing protein [Jiella flava]MBO0663110.1 FAD binding domain-containing protein [Jiella flava]MCD2471529.1 FAD binding domain-containing protein [Jiella flava]
MSPLSSPAIIVPETLADALASLAELGADGTPLAGGTWIMRAPLRDEPMAHAYVALGRIAELRRIKISAKRVEIGASATHAMLAAALERCDDLAALRNAAAQSANPAIRHAATVGGNLCARRFPAPDLATALLGLDASVEVADAAGSERLTMEAFLAARGALGPGRIVTKVIVERTGHRSAHSRLPLRKAGDYPVAIVSVAVRLDDADRIVEARIAVGSVEGVPRRWTALEEALAGQPIAAVDVAAIARPRADRFTGRDGVEAPGWYRVHVLPVLVGRAFAALTSAAT